MRTVVIFTGALRTVKKTIRILNRTLYQKITSEEHRMRRHVG